MKDSMKVGVDISALDPNFKEHQTRGIGRYAAELKKHFDLKAHNQISVDYFSHLDLMGSSLAKLVDYAPLGRQTLKQQLVYPLKLNSGDLKGLDVLHFLAQTDGPSWCKKPYILSVMDIIPHVCSELYKAKVPNWRYRLARFLEIKSIKNAELIITISEYSKRDLIEYMDIPAEKIFVTPLGVSDTFSKQVDFDFPAFRDKHSLPTDREFLLYVGGIDPRKNSKGLLQSYKRLLDLYRSEEKLAEAPLLFFVGQISQDREYPAFKSLVKELDLADWIYELGFVSNEELGALYGNCQALCFLSLYEGFGLTPLEAMSAGAPVVSSNLSAMPEVLEDAVMLVDPNNYEEVSNALYFLLNNNSMRKEFSALGREQAAKYTWDRTAELTYAAYEHFASIHNTQESINHESRAN